MTHKRLAIYGTPDGKYYLVFEKQISGFYLLVRVANIISLIAQTQEYRRLSFSLFEKTLINEFWFKKKATNPNIENKKYRYDLNLWEEEKKFLIKYYRYSIWRDGKLRVAISLLKK